MTRITRKFTWFVKHCKNILIIKPTRCTKFSIYFWNKTLHVSDSYSVHHQAFFTVHIEMVYVIQVCWQLASRIRTELSPPDPARKLSANLYDIYHCCVYSEKLLMMDRGTVRNMWSFISKINCQVSASSWFYYKNLSRCTVTWTSNCKNISIKWGMNTRATYWISTAMPLHDTHIRRT